MHGLETLDILKRLKMKYQCEGCDATFEGTAEEAFDLGWDTPERFFSHTTCPNCPITSTLWWSMIKEKNGTSN